MSKFDTIVRWFFNLVTAAYAIGLWTYAITTPTEGITMWLAMAVAWLCIMVLNIIGQLHLREVADKRARESVQKMLDKTYGQWETREDA